MDWIKALFIGVALIAGTLAVSVVVALLLPILSFIAIVVLIWFLLQMINHDDDPKKPP